MYGGLKQKKHFSSENEVVVRLEANIRKKMLTLNNWNKIKAESNIGLEMCEYKWATVDEKALMSSVRQ